MLIWFAKVIVDLELAGGIRFKGADLAEVGRKRPAL